MKMARMKFGHSVAVAACFSSFVSAQDEAETCYGPGSVVGAVVGTSIVIIGLFVSGFFLYKMYWKNRKGKHLVLMTDAETPHDQYAFDNPCFREASPIKHGIEDEKHGSKLEKIKWPGWPPVHTFGKEKKGEKIISMDDSCLNDSRLKVVTLKGHDFTGLGFNICGNMRDGIFVKDVLHRGPAFESGCINTGDRIDSVCISFRNMVFEDALTILSYASPYDVQVQVENDSYSRPSTLMRCKRESNAVNSSDRILHPKFNRSQSFSHLNEIGKNNNKKVTHQMGAMFEKNRINQSLNNSQDFGYLPTARVSTPKSDGKMPKNLTPKISSFVEDEKFSKANLREEDTHQTKSADSQNKLQKFGIKVLPISINPKMGVQSVTGTKKPAKSPTSIENEINSAKEKPEKTKEPSQNGSLTEERFPGIDEPDSNKENVKGMLAKGFLNLKEKINQNSLGKRKKGEEEEAGSGQRWDGDCPVPRLRSSVPCGVKAYEKNHQNEMSVPEEVSRAGDVARNNRKSTAEGRKPVGSSVVDEDVDPTSDSEEYSDRESVKDESKKPKKSKGKAPAPPKQGITSNEINEIKKESELNKAEMSIFEPETKIIPLKDEDEDEAEKSPRPNYESDSDVEPATALDDGPRTKIELNATQVTVHQGPQGDSNDDDVEPSRKAASLGDLSKLDSEQPLSIVLERAVSLDLTEGTSQCGKKRKAPLPPSEEFPPAFDDLNYRKEPRLEGLNTFQRRLKKSSDFGTLEDAICDGPKSLEAEASKPEPLDLAETHNYNIQEFSSWLAECRRPKPSEEDKPRVNSTSLVNINSSDGPSEEEAGEKLEYQRSNISFSVNGKNFPDFGVKNSSENVNFPGVGNSRTVVVISQPNSLEPAALDVIPGSNAQKEGSDEMRNSSDAPGVSDEATTLAEDDAPPPELPTSPVPTFSPAPAPAPAPAPETFSTPLSSSLTYITEIKVSTCEGAEPEEASSLSVSDRIQKFDSPKGLESSPTKSYPGESSKIPIRTMKSETGQKVLATIQSLAKESSPTKTPEMEYAKRVASLFSNNQRTSSFKLRNEEEAENEIPRPNAAGFYFKTPPPKPSKDYSPTRKVPPAVPPRKMETSIAARAALAAEDANVVTFSSFAGRNKGEEADAPSRIAFRIKERGGEVNGGEDGAAPPQTSPAKIILENNEGEGRP